MNQTTIIGNIGQDADVKSVGNSDIINFSVAVTERWTNAAGEKKDRTTWFRCAKWCPTGKTGLSKYLTKGTKVMVQGRVEADSYLKGQEIVQSLRLNVSEVELLGGQERTEPTPQQPQQRATYSDEELTGDLPF